MKKILIIISIFCLTAACSGGHPSKTKYYSRKTVRSKNSIKHLEKTAAKFIYRIKPSESMQAGIAKENSKSNSFVKNNSLTLKDDGEDDDSATNGNYSGHFKIGNPYEIFGVSYVPQNYEDYEETGVASWYGDDFHGKPTANGELYNMDEMTAAHPTLPLPSLVRVTNLHNGKTVVVRVNDRGPFAKSRVIDVSEKAAITLGFKDKGTTEVKVELLRSETDELLKKLNIKN